MNRNYSNISYAESPFGTLSEFMSKSFGWMFAGLLVTFGVGMGAVASGLIFPIINSGLFIFTSIAELVMVFVLSARVQKLQPSTATALFFGYAVLNGINLSSIFLVYDYGTLILAFLVGAVYFGVMAVYGNVTDRDLTGWGPKLMGGLVALIVCALVGSLLSMFGLNFGIADLLLCAVGLLIFMGLTAYDTQMLKYYYSYFGGDAAMLHKASIIGALNLYLDFINIFLYIVRMLGRRNND
ncbi:MAG: Bax inhibitor-1/YccA family protein [Subdoligranulum variabile]|uniref:Bax inhibitor-1/YccA family protein n=1 Tax=Gemmiger sp. TaxID=2049027 RepID=UPI0025BDAB1F|nr:Bax inhibitor-1/YccA family protein [Gemmiger sp.]MBS6107203.1 Bax inhibitor-1/YccA family protein [Subdoligranulum variabile]